MMQGEINASMGGITADEVEKRAREFVVNLSLSGTFVGWLESKPKTVNVNGMKLTSSDFSWEKNKLTVKFRRPKAGMVEIF